MKEVLKYLQAGAIVPVDMETTMLLVNALQEALAQLPQEPTLQEQLDKANADQDKARAAQEKAYADWVKAHADSVKAEADRDKADVEIRHIKNLMEQPAQRPWVGLTNTEIWWEYQLLWPFHPAEEPELAADMITFARVVLAKSKEKNT